VRDVDPTEDLTTATVMAVVTFLVFAGLVAGLLTGTFDQMAVTWVGAGLVGLGSAVLAAWALVLQFDPDLGPVERYGGDLLLVGFGVLFVAAGLPTFAAGVI
jgi:peptidoglycan/LPS O-acetylase OafA/YrhL